MLENYIKYLVFITNKLKVFFERQKEYICCKKGCSLCCRNAEFPYSKMEVKFLLSGFLLLDKEIQAKIEANLQKTADEKKKFKGDVFLYDCPFLIDGSCSVYDYRGIVCRTFGLMETVKGKNSRVPFCAYKGLNYSQVLDEDKNQLSEEKFKELGFKEEPLSFNIGYKFLTSGDFEKKFNFEFGEKLPLIDWFMDMEGKKYE